MSSRVFEEVERERAREISRAAFDEQAAALSPSWHFFGLTGPDRGMFSASKHNILGSVMA